MIEIFLFFAHVENDRNPISVLMKNPANSISLLEAGEPAPDFLFIDEKGKEKHLSDLRGKKVILFFYPKDLTPGCTAEACNLRDHYSELQKKKFVVIGISADTEKMHVRFREKHGLPFPLVADTDKKIISAYGVWGPKIFMGRKFDGIHRSTFLIDEKGVISHVISKVKTKEHSEQILEIIKK